MPTVARQPSLLPDGADNEDELDAQADARRRLPSVCYGDADGVRAKSLPPQLVTNGPQANPGDSDARSGGRNVADSQRYEQTLHANAAYRQQRMQKECGSIEDQSLHEHCVASFR